MSKSHTFSIYLLKPGFDSGNSLKDDHALESTTASKLPDCVFYLLDSVPKPPWWKDYFGLSNPLEQVSKGALAFLTANSRNFVLSFGHVYHHLKDECYEYDFGLRVTLNCVDPEKLKSTDIVEPGASRRRRTQTPAATDLTYFDIDRDGAIIKSLVGIVKDEHKVFFQHATGSSNLRLSSALEPHRLKELCEKLLLLYQSDVYKASFPDIHNIEPVRDPKKIELLNVELLKALKEKREELYLTVPDILNYSEGLLVSFAGEGESLNYPDLFTSQYFEYLEQNDFDLNEITIEKLKSHRLTLIDDNGRVKESYSILKCIAVDIETPGDNLSYHLCDGNWYRVEKDYITKLQSYLDPCFEDLSLLPFKHDTEGKYNLAVEADDGRFLCLDKTNISPRGNVEPCDLYTVTNDLAVLYHVKVSTRSALLSHLFNQGINAIELIESEDEARNRLKAHVENRLGANNRETYLAPIDQNKFKVVYAIITAKNKANKSKNLPLFSRISLMRSIKTLKLMKIPGAYCFVQDDSEKKPGTSKTRRARQPRVASL